MQRCETTTTTTTTNKQKRSKMIGMSLNAVHRQTNKHITKRSDRLHNHFSFHTCYVSFAVAQRERLRNLIIL